VTPPPNSPPTISGAPASSVSVGVAYSFTPAAADANGDSLTFSIQNKPAWAAFSTSTGRLSGTPAAGDVANYSNIIISVSDGKASVSLAAFSIAVNAVSTGSATFNWTPPTENDDGSALTNLAGYRLVYGTAAGALNQTAVITNPGLTSYVVGNLAPGTWFFAIKAYTTANVESALTVVVSTTIP
jgi:hypothetical protein